MPAASASWFTPALSSQSATKSAMQSNFTSNSYKRDGVDGKTQSFVDSFNAATESARPASDKPAIPADKNVNAKSSEQKTSAGSKNKTSRRDSKKNSTRESTSEEPSSGSIDSESESVSDAGLSAETSESSPPIVNESAEQAETAVSADPVFAFVTANQDQVQDMPEPETEDHADGLSDSEKKNELRLPWRSYQEKPDTGQNLENAKAKTGLTSETKIAANSADDIAQQDQAADDAIDTKPITQAPLEEQDSQEDAILPEAESDPQKQSRHVASGSGAETAQAKNYKSKVKPEPTAKPDSSAYEVKNSDNAAHQASAAQAHPAETPVQISVGGENNTAPAARDSLAPTDTTAGIFSGSHVQQDSHSQTGAASSARLAQQTAQESSTETFDQIVLGLKTKIDPKNTKAEIHLNPPDLGALKVSVSISDGQLTAEFTAQNQMVRDLLSNNMERLRNVLEGQGVTVDRLAVQTAPGAEVASSQSSSNQQDARNAFDSQHDGRSNGNMGQQQRSPQRQNANDFASMLNQEKPLDMVA